jgi:hypothetical protein
VREPDDNELHHEITALYDAARRRRYEKTVSLREGLSPRAVAYLEDRLKRPGPRAARLRLPAVEALRDLKRRDEACEMIGRLCRIGGVSVEGRKRSGGKRSRPTLRPRLHAPELRRHVPKREPERNFVMNLQTVWLEATGRNPPLTARHEDDSRFVGPLARVAKKCLDHLGARHVDVVQQINQLNRHRVRKRHALVRLPQKERAAKRARRVSRIKT